MVLPGELAILHASKTSQPQSSCIYTNTGIFEESPMFFRHLRAELRAVRWAAALWRLVAFLLLCLSVLGTLATAQSGTQQTSQQSSQQNPSQQPPANPNQQEAPPEAGGPQNDVGPYVIPKKKEEPPPPAPEKPKKIDNMPDYSIKVEVPIVTLDVLVTTKDGQTIPGLTSGEFQDLRGRAAADDRFLQPDARRRSRRCS